MLTETETQPLVLLPTQRQLEVLCLVANWNMYREIAAKLGISRRTVEHHVKNAKQRMGYSTRDALIRYLLSIGVIHIGSEPPMQN